MANLCRIDYWVAVKLYILLYRRQRTENEQNTRKFKMLTLKYST